MEKRKGRKRLSQAEKEAEINERTDLFDWDEAIPERGYKDGQEIQTLMPFSDVAMEQEAIGGVSRLDEQNELDDGILEIDAFHRTIGQGEAAIHHYKERYRHYAHFTKACGKARELELKKRFGALPISAQSISNARQTPQMSLLPIGDLSSERLLTLAPKYSNAGGYYLGKDGLTTDDIFIGEYDFFPAGMTFNLALESCLEELEVSVEELVADFPINDSVETERDLLYVVVEVLAWFSRHDKKLDTQIIYSLLDTLRPFVYTPESVDQKPTLLALKTLMDEGSIKSGSIYTRFDAIYYSLLFFADKKVARCRLCGRFFFPETGKQEYCLFNCPGADRRTCQKDGIRLVTKKDETTYKKKVDGLRRKIDKRIRAKQATKEYQHLKVYQLTNAFQNAYHNRKNELFKREYKDIEGAAQIKADELKKAFTDEFEDDQQEKATQLFHATLRELDSPNPVAVRKASDRPYKKWQLLYEWLADYKGDFDNRWQELISQCMQ